MIASLKGRLLEKNLADVVLEVGGVGYRVNVSLLTMTRMPEEGREAALRVQTVVRQDALELFGFLSRPEEELFLMLTSVSHVGPRLAMTVLSGLEIDELTRAIAHGEVARLTKIHGVGKKTAERLVLELKDRVKALAVAAKPTSGGAGPTAGARSDLVSALVNLGYKQPLAEKAAAAAFEQVGAEAPFEAQFKEALKTLRA